ncbi:MAG: ATP-binding cassette domain-containing protein, partial [Pseudothermotoga sp.]|nr:ATP-binding cassette domain-containing protein [Pseudothermotoga sp.]
MSEVVFEIKNLYAFYNDHCALQNVNLKIREKGITAIMGPSGCGKSTLLRCLNRLNDLIVGFSLKGQILFRGQDIY